MPDGRSTPAARRAGGALRRDAARSDLAHHPGIEVGDDGTDRGVQLDEPEELLVAQAGQHVSLHDQHRDLDFGLIAGLVGTRRQDRRVIVGGEILVGAVDAGLVAARGGDASLEVVADDGVRDAADRRESVDVRADPIRQSLAPTRFRIGVVRGAEHGHEHVRLGHLPGRRVDHGNRVAGEVDEQLLAGPVRLAHRR